jgi:hypothetical protein
MFRTTLLNTKVVLIAYWSNLAGADYNYTGWIEIVAPFLNCCPFILLKKLKYHTYFYDLFITKEK